jgi:hypothetical protein
MEQEALAIKINSRRQELQADLNRKREVIDQLTDRMKDLEEIGAEEDFDSSEGEDVLGEIIATPSESMDSRSTDIPSEEPEKEEAEPIPGKPELPTLAPAPAPAPAPEPGAGEETLGPAPTQGSISGKPATIASQTMRARGRPSVPEENTAKTTSSSLFPSRTTTALSTTATTEAILDHQRAEQDLLSDSILKMATDLKASSQAFSLSLEEDRDVLSRAGEGLDKNERSLEAAAKRMGVQRKMTEGRGWWGRMLLYAWIYGLMVLLVLVVFVLPKLRF